MCWRSYLGSLSFTNYIKALIFLFLGTKGNCRSTIWNKNMPRDQISLPRNLGFKYVSGHVYDFRLSLFFFSDLFVSAKNWL